MNDATPTLTESLDAALLRFAVLTLLRERPPMSPNEIAGALAGIPAWPTGIDVASVLADLVAAGLIEQISGERRQERVVRYHCTGAGARLVGDWCARWPWLGSEETRLEEARAALARERETVERLRTDLLSTVSHELQTPLTLIRTSIGLLLDSEPDEAMWRRLPHNIKQSTEVLGATDGEIALDEVERERPDVVLLDMMMPGMDGYETPRQLRTFSDVPVIMLTGKDGVLDKVKGLELGDDDDVTKPFDHLELLARVKALMRRLAMPQPASRAPSFVRGQIAIDFARQEVRLDGEPVALTPIEYKLRYHLVRNADHILRHETLLSKVWEREYADEVDDLRVYIRPLRMKLDENPEQPRHILTERGLGYRFRTGS